MANLAVETIMKLCLRSDLCLSFQSNTNIAVKRGPAGYFLGNEYLKITPCEGIPATAI